MCRFGAWHARTLQIDNKPGAQALSREQKEGVQ
jgi:hypothetical protein